jgi:hypothetical protein
MKIFKSKFTLSLIDEYQDKMYMEDKKKAADKYYFYHALIIFILLIIILGYNLYNSNAIFKEYSMYVTFSLTVIFSFSYIAVFITVIRVKNRTFKLWINYMNYFTLPWVCIFIRDILTYYDIPNKQEYSSIILMIEVLLRITWLLTDLLDFTDSLIINSIRYLIFLMTYLYEYDRNYFSIIQYLILLFFISLITYFYTLNKKTLFFVRNLYESKYKQCVDIFENMSSGFIRIKDGKIVYMNKTFYEIMDGKENNTLTAKNLIDGEIDERSYSDEMLNKILNNITHVYNDRESSIKFEFEEFKKNSQINNFKFIGFTKIKINEIVEIHFEVWCRYFYRFGGNCGFEFLLNNVTQVNAY